MDMAVAPPPPNVDQSEITMAMLSSGVLSSTECLADLEMEAAPPLSDSTPTAAANRLSNTAACLATSVLPDRGNGEVAAERAAELASRREAAVRFRYHAEVQVMASRLRLRRSPLGRKRSVDDVDLQLALKEIESGAGRLEVTAGAPPASPETKRTLRARLAVFEEPGNK
jgi:hypothetical protein